MSVPFTIGLPSGKILISDSVTGLGFSGVTGMAFGYVQQVYNGCMVTVVGNNVMYPKEAGAPLTYSGVNYFVINETDIVLYESIPLLD